MLTCFQIILKYPVYVNISNSRICKVVKVVAKPDYWFSRTMVTSPWLIFRYIKMLAEVAS